MIALAQWLQTVCRYAIVNWGVEQADVPSNSVVERQGAFAARNGNTLQRGCEACEKIALNNIASKINVGHQLRLDSSDAGDDVTFEAVF